MESLPQGKSLPGDKAYRSMPLQMDLFEKFEVKLKVPFRINQHDYKRHPKKYRRKRQMVETFFAQMTDQFSVKRDYAKTYQVLQAKLSSKLSAMSLVNWINFQNGRKLSQIKHALSF